MPKVGKQEKKRTFIGTLFQLFVLLKLFKVFKNDFKKE